MEKHEVIDENLHNKNSDYVFISGSYFSIQFKILGLSLILISLVKIYSILNFLYLILFFIGAIFIFAKKGVIVSYSLKRYRDFFSFFNFKLGNWVAFPDFEYISMFSAKKSLTTNYNSISNTAKFSEIELNLIYNKNKKLNVYLTNDYFKALEKAKYFEKLLNIKIYDATSKEPKWI